MSAFCSTRPNDVNLCVKAIRKGRGNGPLVQVGIRTYDTCEKDQILASDVFRKRINRMRHQINFHTGTLHEKGCSMLKKTDDGHLVEAFITNPQTTGLRVCQHCIKKGGSNHA